MTDVVMPALSDSMTEGTILTWLVDDGGEVAAGQELVEIETDKATMTYEAEADGTLSIAQPAGSTVPVGEVIGRLGKGAPAHAAGGAGAGDTETEAGGGETEAEAETAGETPVVDAAPVTSATVTAQANGNGRPDVAATPMARRIAAVHEIALGELTGTGPRGRIVRADVLRAAGVEPAGTPTPTPTNAPTPARGERVELTRLQRTIARRMAESKATVPHFQVQTEVEMSAALAFREQLKAHAAGAEADAPAVVPSLNDLIVKACALCLRRFPHANGSYADGAFVLHEQVNVGIAVAAEGALVVPVIHDADTRTLGQIAVRSRELAAAVRDGSVTPPQLSGATFTVSNLGMFGMTAITPVIDAPQAAILGVGAIRQTLARGGGGEVVDRPLLTLTLSCDHRILYGADAARFLAAIAQALAAPASLAL